MKVLFVAGFGPIVRDLETSARFYRDALGLPLPEGDRKLLAAILMKDDEELSPERLDGAVRALRKIHLRRRLEQVQRELQSAGGKDPGQLQELLQEKMRLKRALMDPGIADSGTAIAV